MGGLSWVDLASTEVISSFQTGSTASFPLRLPNGVAIPRNIMLLVGFATSARLSDIGRCECMKLGTTVTEIIAFDSQFLIFHVCDTIICKVSDKLSDFESGELYDML